MKLETFFEKFDQFADAPDAVAKMREMVLELAVKGALSDRHASDQDDPTWREFVTTFDQRGSDSDTDSQPPFEIPAAWRWACLDDLGTTRVRNDVEDSVRASFVPMALISSTYGVAAQSEERTWSEIKKGFTHFADGDVVMAKITPCFENAKSAVMRSLVNGVGAGTTELHVFRRERKIVLPEFVLLYVKTRGFIMRGERRMTGSAGQKRVPREYFARSPFPLPPLAEQKRIVAKVDELMALCDRLEAQQQERETRHAALARASLARFADAPTPANLPFLFHPSYAIRPADLRKSILTLAVQGKLVPQDPNDEPAEELLQRVDTERERLVKSKKIRRQDFLGPVADDAIAFDIPASWQWRYLADVCFLITDGAHHTPQYLESGVPFLSVKDVSGGSIDFSSTRFISEEAHRELCKRCPPKRGDILLTKVGTTGIAVTIDEDREFSIFVSLALLKFSQPNLDGRYLKHLINSPFVKQQSADNTQGIGNKNLVLRLINRFTVPIPPLAEQRRIVAKVEQLMALVDALETQLAASRATAANLLSALVAELTGTPSNGKISVPSASVTGRRGRPPKS